jgi:hypothetical protein
MNNYYFFGNGHYFKSQDLNELQQFVNDNFNVSFEYWKLHKGAIVIFSSCGNYSIEYCEKVKTKIFHQIPTIAEKLKPNRIQN